MDLTTKYICTFCASSSRIDPEYISAARELGHLIGKYSLGSICGAGIGGLMAAVIEGTREAGGDTIGVIPGFMVDRHWNHPELMKTVVTVDMHSRKRTMLEFCGALIALPGGVGTLEELLEVITWKQLGLFDKPIIILNTKGYYDPLLEMFRKSADEKFMSDATLDLWKVVNTPQEAIDLLLSLPAHSKTVEKKY